MSNIDKTFKTIDDFTFLMNTMELRDTYIEQKLKEEISEIK